MKKRGRWFVLIAFMIAGLVLLYFIVDSESLQTLVLSLLIIVVVFGAIILLWGHGNAVHVLSQKIQELEPLIARESAEALKDKYVEIYNLYMKLPENQKPNFYGKLMNIREKMEETMKAEKKMSELFDQAGKGGIVERRRNYALLYENFQKLPKRGQEVHYPKLIALKQSLGRGK